MTDATADQEAIVFFHEHSVEGFVKLTVTGALLRFECRWPFDLDEGDWIFITGAVPAADVQASLARLAVTGQGRTEAAEGGFIEFAAQGANETRIELADKAPVGPVRLSLNLPRNAEELAETLTSAIRAAQR